MLCAIQQWYYIIRIIYCSIWSIICQTYILLLSAALLAVWFTLSHDMITDNDDALDGVLHVAHISLTSGLHGGNLIVHIYMGLDSISAV